ncbi:MAG: hypothetical protein AB7T74_05365 [Clostridia bacterium]
MDRKTVLGPYSILIMVIFALAVLVEAGFPAADVGHLTWPLAVLNALFMILALLPVRGYVLKVSIVCLAVAAGIALFWKVPALALAEAFNKSSGIIAFIAVVPAVAIPIRLGGYMEAMEAFLSADPSSRQVRSADKTSWPELLHQALEPFVSFLVLAGLNLLMSFVLNIGSIPIMQRLLEKARLPKPYLSLLYSTAYSSYMVVSPFDGLIQALILATGASYATYVSHGLAMTGAIMATGLLILALSPRSIRPGKTNHDQPSDHQNHQQPRLADQAHSPAAEGSLQPGRRILELAAHIIAMIVLAVVLGRLIKLGNPALGTAFVIVVYTLFWLRLLDVGRKELKGSVREYALALAGFRAFLPFLVSASLLGAMTAYTPLNGAIASALLQLGNLSRYFSIQAIMAVTALLSMVGIHMMITVAAVASAVDPVVLGLDPPAFALFLLSCWFVAMNVSPFVPFSTVVGEAIRESPATVALRYNSKMAVLMLFIAPLVIILA